MIRANDNRIPVSSEMADALMALGWLLLPSGKEDARWARYAALKLLDKYEPGSVWAEEMAKVRL